MHQRAPTNQDNSRFKGNHMIGISFAIQPVSKRRQRYERMKEKRLQTSQHSSWLRSKVNPFTVDRNSKSKNAFISKEKEKRRWCTFQRCTRLVSNPSSRPFHPGGYILFDICPAPKPSKTRTVARVEYEIELAIGCLLIKGSPGITGS